MNTFLAWVIVWFSGVAAFLAFLVTVNLVTEYRRLRAARIPLPAFVLWQRTVDRLLSGDAALDELRGRQVWVSWDIRWVTCGETTARVMDARQPNELLLELDKPIFLEAFESMPGVKIETVRFIPRNRTRAAYGRYAVAGILEPAIMHGLNATAQIVVYRTGA